MAARPTCSNSWSRKARNSRGIEGCSAARNRGAGDHAGASMRAELRHLNGEIFAPPAASGDKMLAIAAAMVGAAPQIVLFFTVGAFVAVTSIANNPPEFVPGYPGPQM